MNSRKRTKFLLPAFAILASAAFLLSTWAEPRPTGDAFTLAFSADKIDMTLTRTSLNGKATPGDAAIVSRTLGLTSPDGNWEENRWEAGKVGVDAETTFDYLVVLKEPVTVGTVAIEPADFSTNTGSRNGGEVFYLKDNVSAAPNPVDQAQWNKIEFTGVQQLLRSAALPPGTKTRAFLYRDVRTAGSSSLAHWNFYRARLADLTFSAKGYCAGGASAGDPDGIARGTGWSSLAAGKTKSKNTAPTPKNPTWYVLAWDKPQDIAGLFFSSNITAFNVYRMKGDVAANPALAPAQDWEKIDAAAVRECTHKFKWWGYFTRWVNLPAGATRAVKIEITGSNGNDAWISGFGSFIDLKDATPPAITQRDDGPPFRIPAAITAEGPSALAIDTADGHRLLNLSAQTVLPKATREIPWNLKDPTGNYVAPGNYRLKAITGPLVELVFQNCPYPNVQNYFPDRTPWLTSHDGPNGWLSDHSQNWAVTSVGDHVYFGAPMAEAGVCMIETDLDGKKLWGRHDFGAWLGVNRLTADQKSVFIESTGHKIYRMDPATHEASVIFPIGTPERRGSLTAISAHDNKVYLAFSGIPLFDNPTSTAGVDLEHCLPKPTTQLPHLLRLGGRVPGKEAPAKTGKPQGNGDLNLETTEGTGDEQYTVIAFKQPVPIGSIVFPHPVTTDKLEFSVLKADAPFPPRPSNNKDWTPLPDQGRPGRWECLTAAENTLTRALRVKISRSGGDALSDKQWFAHLDGLRILNRRFKDLSTTAAIRVNSGKPTANGEWEAQRTEAIGEDKPAVYLMEWTTPQKIDGLAIKEIDGARAEIDVWNGPDGTIPLDAPVASPTTAGWKNVATFKPGRRTAKYKADDNQYANYIDGYVEFKENGVRTSQTTRAVRIRIVEPWMDNAEGGCLRHDGRDEHGMHISKSYIMNLDTRRCKIYGVAPLQYLGGEPPIDSLVYERLEIHDGTTGTLLKELPVHLGWHGLGFLPSGELVAINGDHRSIVKVNTDTGALTTLVNVECANMAVGPDGNLYVMDFSDVGHGTVRVFDTSGRFLHTIGNPGGAAVGPWDPQRFNRNVISMCVDRNLSLWIVEGVDNPRRVLQYNATTGKLLKEMTGSTHYGGGGTLNRYDISRAYLGNTEFEIDYAKNFSRIHSQLVQPFYGNDLVAARANGHTYLVTVPITLNDRQSVPIVYLADDNTPVRMVAAFGNADHFPPLRASAIVSLLGGKCPEDFKFIWTDRNGDGKVSPDEVTFEPKADDERGPAFGPFDTQLGCMGTDARYEVKETLPNGSPVYQRVASPNRGSFLKLNNGNFLTLHGHPGADGPESNFVTDPNGKLLWSYPVSNAGVSGLSIHPWKAGDVANEFGIIGHETDPGDLGEFVVTSGNDGQWRIWTADGLLAGQILLHKTDPRAHFLSMPDIKPGMRVDPLTGSQEHFHGFFTRAEATGKYYIITGFTSMSIMEVRGLDRFKRVTTDFTVTQADIDRAKAWESQQVRRLVESRPSILKVKAIDPLDGETPKIDGLRKPKEWGDAGATMGNDNPHTFSMAYDEKNLYLCWTAKGIGPFKNSGGDFQRLFKTGAAVDLLLGTSPDADPARTKPVAGDLRLLISMVAGKPRVVLYQPVAPGAKATEAWRAYTPAGGETAFQRVVELPNAKVAASGGNDFTVEASIPLSDLGLKPKKGLRLRMDWGFLTTDDGNQVKDRLYWSNRQATGTSDEAIEARLEPQFWGYANF